MVAILLIALLAVAPITRSPFNNLLSPSELAVVKVVLVFILFGLWGITHILTKAPRRLPSWIAKGIWVWMGLSLVSLTHAYDPLVAVRYLSHSAAGVAIFLVVFHQDRPWQHRIAMVLIAGAAAVALIGVLQYLIVKNQWYGILSRWLIEPRTQSARTFYPDPMMDELYRVSSTFLHPNHLGAFMGLFIPLPVAWLFSRKPFWLKSWMVLVMIVLVFAALYASNSRNGVFCLLVGLTFLGLQKGYRWIPVFGGAVLAMFIALTIMTPIRDAFGEKLMLLSRAQYGLSGRETVWRNTIELIAQDPLLGVGPGNLSRQYVSHFGYFIPNHVSEMMEQIWAVQSIGDSLYDLYHAHNVYLQLMAESGAIAPILYLLACALLLRFLLRRAAALPIGCYRRAWLLGTASSVVALLAFGLFDSQASFVLGSLNLFAAPILALGLRS